jgi:acyl carrier protein
MAYGGFYMDSNTAGAVTSPSHEFLTELWTAQLNRPRIDICDDFFDAGGSSMQVIEMLMAVSNRFGKEIDYAEFFKDPCIRKLSELLDN